MALNISTTYCGEDAGIWVRKALIGGDTLASNCVTLVPNIKLKAPINRLNSDDILQADGCDFAPVGTITLDSRELFPQAQKVNLELCISELESHWISANMAAGANNPGGLPQPFNEFLMDWVAGKVAEGVESKLWAGSIVGGDVFDGIVTKLVAAGGFLAPAIPAVLNEGNIISTLKEMYGLVPPSVCDEMDLKIFVSKKALKFYKLAVAAASNEKYYIGDVAPDFLGMPLVALRGMPDDTIIIAQVSNLFVGTDLLSDMNEFKMIDMRDTTGADTVRIKGRFKFDANFAFSEEVVMHNV